MSLELWSKLRKRERRIVSICTKRTPFINSDSGVVRASNCHRAAWLDLNTLRRFQGSIRTSYTSHVSLYVIAINMAFLQTCGDVAKFSHARLPLIVQRAVYAGRKLTCGLEVVVQMGSYLALALNEAVSSCLGRISQANEQRFC